MDDDKADELRNGTLHYLSPSFPGIAVRPIKRYNFNML